MGLRNCDPKTWLLIIIPFRLFFRLLILLNLGLIIVLFLNVPVFSKMPEPRVFLPLYLIGMLAIEIYLIFSMRKGKFHRELLLLYFGIALIFEFPYAPFREVYEGFNPEAVGLFLFVLPWYLSALIGLPLVLRASNGGDDHR